MAQRAMRFMPTRDNMVINRANRRRRLSPVTCLCLRSIKHAGEENEIGPETRLGFCGRVRHCFSECTRFRASRESTSGSGNRPDAVRAARKETEKAQGWEQPWQGCGQ